MTDGVMGPVEL